jgi:hypothetical protein
MRLRSGGTEGLLAEKLEVIHTPVSGDIYYSCMHIYSYIYIQMFLKYFKYSTYMYVYCQHACVYCILALFL